MTSLSDKVVRHLTQIADRPDLSGTRYEALDVIGRGGMGTVYRAHDAELGRDVALKVLSVAGARQVAERMVREARILARLEHPGIVPVHDVGRLPDGRIFYTMKLVRGRRLDEWAHDGVSLPEALHLFERVLEPIAFAHATGVIHRDLKPENVMIGSFGEVLVLDWGVAKLLHGAEPPGHGASVPLSDPAATDPGTVLGTPRYMAPEQAAGSADQIDVRTDIYALGGILFYLLHRTPPPPADGSRPTHAAGSPRPGPRPLEAICRRALAVDARERYQTVPALAADVHAYLLGEPVAAYREGIVERVGRFGRKYRAALILVGAYLAMRLLLLVFSR